MTTSVVEERKPNRSRGRYRDNVAAMIVNSRGRILILKRAKATNHWQLPQGGIDKGETPRQTALREVREETGLTKLKIVAIVPNFYEYAWPKVPKYADAEYIGQRQTLFLMRHLGRDADVRIDHHEAVEYQWVHPRDFVSSIARVRKTMAQRAIAIYNDILKTSYDR